jgi:hypothetical protein
VLDVEPVETLFSVGLEKVDDLFGGERVPVLIVEKLDGSPSCACVGPG